MHHKSALIVVLGTALVFSANVVTIGPNKEFRLNGQPFFPIMQWMQNNFLVRSQVEYGFNVFAVPGNNVAAKSWCDTAAKYGVYACCTWKAADVNAVIDHNGFFGWFFGDEPDLQSNAIRPDSIRRQYEAIKAADTKHPAFLTITAGFYSQQSKPAWMNGSDSFYYSYPRYADAVGFDHYPVYGWCRPDWIHRVADAQSELGKKYCAGAKSTYQWIECVRTSSQWCELSARGENDGPYDYEIENQVWLAIVNGANAIGYFTHSWECPGYAQFCISAEQGTMLKKVNGRITALTSVLCAADAPVTVTATTMGVGAGSGRIDTRAKVKGDSLYVIAATVLNLSGAADSQRVAITVPGLTSEVSVLFEERKLTPANGAFTDGFGKRSSVHIYAMKMPTSTEAPKLRFSSPTNPRVPASVAVDIRGRIVSSRTPSSVCAGVYFGIDPLDNPAADRRAVQVRF